MKKWVVLLLVLLVALGVVGAVSAEGDAGILQPVADPENNVSDAFRAALGQGVKAGIIPSVDGDFYYLKSFEDSYDSMADWIHMFPMMTDDVKNFVLSAKITWESANQTPNLAESACGLIFRDDDNESLGASREDNYLYSSLAMDGKDYLFGLKDDNWVSYKRYFFVNPTAAKTTFDYTIYVYNGNISVIVNGKPIRSTSGVAVETPGSIHYAIQSGTNKGFGTRCTFDEINLVVFP